MLSESTRLKANQNCTWKELAGNVIILQSDTRPPVTHELNSTSSFVWTVLQAGEIIFSDLLEAFLKEFEVDDSTARNDIEELLVQLESKNLLCIQT